MDFKISDEQKQLYESARDFGRKEVFPGILERDPAKVWSNELFLKLADLGLLGAPFPEEYGGSGLNAFETCLVNEGFGEGSEDGGLTLAWGAHTILCGIPIWKLGTKKQKEKYLPKMSTGEWIGAFCLSEPDSGSDAASMKTRAVKKGDRYILNGTKMWITNGPVANHFIVTAVTDPERKSAGISTFIVEKDFPGFKVGQHIEKLGLKTSTTAEIIFENCEVPAENLLGEENLGFLGTTKLILGWERSCLLAPSVGYMKALIDRCVNYSKERQQFGRPIAKFQALRHMMADMRMHYELARLLIYKVAWHLDKTDTPPLVDAAIAKVFVAEKLQKIARDAVQIHGGNGFTPEYHVERIYRDSMLSSIGAGTSEIQRSIIAQSMMGLRF